MFSICILLCLSLLSSLSDILSWCTLQVVDNKFRWYCYLETGLLAFKNNFFHFFYPSIFVLGIGRFSEAILDYCANIENAPYPDISKDRFCGEIFSAYEIMFNIWLQSKEAKVSWNFLTIQTSHSSSFFHIVIFLWELFSFENMKPLYMYACVLLCYISVWNNTLSHLAYYFNCIVGNKITKHSTLVNGL